MMNSRAVDGYLIAKWCVFFLMKFQQFQRPYALMITGARKADIISGRGQQNARMRNMHAADLLLTKGLGEIPGEVFRIAQKKVLLHGAVASYDNAVSILCNIIIPKVEAAHKTNSVQQNDGMGHEGGSERLTQTDTSLLAAGGSSKCKSGDILRLVSIAPTSKSLAFLLSCIVKNNRTLMLLRHRAYCHQLVPTRLQRIASVGRCAKFANKFAKIA